MTPSWNSHLPVYCLALYISSNWGNVQDAIGIQPNTPQPEHSPREHPMAVEIGEHDEFERLYGAAAPWLYSYLFSLLGNPDDAEDVLQETARLCWEKFDQYEPGTEFRAWACRIAHFKAMKHRQRRQKRPAVFSDLFCNVIDEEAVVMADKLDLRIVALTECVQKLPDTDRRLLDLRYEPGATAEQVAKSLGKSIHAVYRAMARIHDTLYRCVNRTLGAELRS